MPNFALFRLTAEQLLGDAGGEDELLYEENVMTLTAGHLAPVHHQISSSQAHAIMRRIVDDDVITAALLSGIEEARLNPDGNMPVDGAHPVNPVIALVAERAIPPVLGTLPPSNVTLRFVRMAHDRVKANN